jgi:hypothetical protein
VGAASSREKIRIFVIIAAVSGPKLLCAASVSKNIVFWKAFLPYLNFYLKVCEGD